jgi:hypothetical protein
MVTTTSGSRPHIPSASPRRTIPWREALCLSLGLILLPGAAHAQFVVGSGVTVDLGNAALVLGCNNLEIEPGGVLNAGTATISLAGSWVNRGTFLAGASAVSIGDGCVPEASGIFGDNVFFDFSVITTLGKLLTVESGSTQRFENSLTLLGGPPGMIELGSSLPGSEAYFDLPTGASQNIAGVDVLDNHAIGQVLARGAPANSDCIDSGNSQGWFSLSGGAIPMASPAKLALLSLLLALSGLLLIRRWQIA